MRYAYYPGCSLQATGCAYDESTRAVARHLGIDLEELEDWNCCGATTYMSVRELLSVSISARNLSLAEQQGLDLVAPCSACFTVLRKTDHYLEEMPQLASKVSNVLAAADLGYDPGSVKVLHLLELFIDSAQDLSSVRTNGNRDGRRPAVRSAVPDLVTTPLTGLRVAPYYGCQIVRPRVAFDDPEFPTLLDDLMRAIGATVVYYPVKSRCCGASLMASQERAAIRLCKNLLLCAQQNGAECIVTLCPLCQMNLDAFQDEVNETYGTRFKIPVLYFTQVVGLAMGLSPGLLGLGREIVSARSVLSRFIETSSIPFMARTTDQKA